MSTSETKPTRSILLRGTVVRESLTPFASPSPDAAFVGSDLDALPATSAFGLLARVVRLNALEPVDLFRLLEIRTHRTDDLSEVMTFSEARQAAFATALRLPSAPPTWNLSTWFPFQSSPDILRSDWIFRFCPECLHSGYHTLLHQLPWIGRCPWHGAALLKVCPRCGNAPAALADWSFDKNLTCECGHSLLSTQAALKRVVGPPEGAAAFIAQYLEWAAHERARTHLVTPELPANTASALGNLVRLPSDLACKCEEPGPQAHKRSWRTGTCVPLIDHEAIRQLDILREDRPGFLAVPTELRASIAGVAANLAFKLPASALADQEMTLFLAGAGIEPPRDFEPARREPSGTLSALPPWEVAGQQFLNLACLHPMSYRAVAKLIDAVLDGRSLFDFHGQATGDEMGLLIKISGRLLARGYAEGLRATLSRHIPDLFSMGRDSPHLTQPWMLTIRDQARLVGAHVIWHPVGLPHTSADMLEEANEANQRRERHSRRGRPRDHRS